MKYPVGVERSILALTHPEGDLVFVGKSTWPVCLVAAHKRESLAGPILQACLCPPQRGLFPMVTGADAYLEGVSGKP